jgi:hypothetical protein
MWMMLAAIAVTGTLSTLTDWLFMGVLFHDLYNRYPEVWWPGIREGKDRRAIIWASVLGYVMTTAVILLCVITGVHSIGGGLFVGFVAWLAGPPIVIIVNGMFIKIDPKITAAHCAGYLARMLLAGAGAGIVLSMSAAATG